MTILNIETSTAVCSAALTEGGQAIKAFADFEGHNHAKQLPLFVEDLLAFLRQEHKTLDAVALSQGPGSYTGLRIGTATAKGLCYGLQIPLLAIDTLQILAAEALPQIQNDKALLCPMIDARRMEVYCRFYGTDLSPLAQTEAEVITEQSFSDQLAQGAVYFFGDGAAKCKTTLTHPNAFFLDSIVPLAEQMGRLAEEAYAQKNWADIAYFSPFYLKEFQASLPKHKVL